MRAQLRLLGLILLLEVSWVVAAQTADSTLQARFQGELDQLCRLYHFPGATAAFVLADGEQAGFATGYADREQSIPMRPDNLQLAGSVGKTFVSAVILSLAQDGTLNLDDKISKWLGRERWFARLPNQNFATIRTLLNCTSGIPDHTRDERFISAVRRRLRSDADFVFSPEELVQFVLDKDALNAPGRRFSYSDTNYILAGMIIERATRSSYYSELTQRFLTPLGLSMTGLADRRGLPSLATGYVAGKNTFGLPRKTVSRGMLVVNPLNEWTGGGLVSNPQDLARWAKALYEGKALREPYVDEMIGSAVPTRNGRRYGLGVEIDKSDLGPVYGHEGWFPGYRTKMAYFPDHGIAVAMQINTDEDVDERECVLSLARTLVGKVPKQESRARRSETLTHH